MGDEGNIRAFNQGCQARIDGKPLWANPYAVSTPWGSWWRSGHMHADRWWGVDAKPKVKPLPPVRTA